MNRDGANQSLWQEGTPNYQSKNPFNPEQIYDVLIVGAGITGVTTAFLLQEAGQNCIVAEAYNPGFGTTGGTTAHLNTMLDTPYNQIESDFGKENAQLVADVTNQAIHLIENLSQRFHIDCNFGYRDGYIFSQNEQETKELDKMYEAARRVGIPIEYVNEIPIPARLEKAVRFSGQAQFHPVKFINGLLPAYERMGGVIVSNCFVKKVEDEAELLVAHTSQGLIRAHQVIYATHLPPGITAYSFKCAPYRSYAVAFESKDVAPLDALVYDMKSPYNYYRSQTVNGKNYMLIGGFDHKTGHETHTEKSFLELEALVKQLYPIDHVDFKWSSQYWEPVDGMAYIGNMEDNIYVATGFSGNGITLGTVSALVLRDLIVNGKSKYEKVFDAGRIKPLASFGTFMKEQTDVVNKFIGKRLNTEKIEALVDLAPGEGAVVKYDGKKLALYKDERGSIRALDPVCPHAKCYVAWNDSEKSWDCPCHGSRFDVNGKILTGPVMHELKKVELTDLTENKGERSQSK